jgi:hypothetical protein
MPPISAGRVSAAAGGHRPEGDHPPKRGQRDAREAADWVAYCLEGGMDVASFCLGNEVHFGVRKGIRHHDWQTETQYVRTFTGK